MGNSRIVTPILERLMKFVLPVTETGCWIWMGSMRAGGYGSIRLGPKGKMALAHRVAYEQLQGPIPDGLELDHLCRVRCCVNPKHLEPVTRTENRRRGIINMGPALEAAHNLRRQQTHCKRGHEFTEQNTRRANGRRHCRTCSRIFAHIPRTP